MVDQNKLGLYKKMKVDKITKELEEIQSAGEESILLIANRLKQELIDQGYSPDRMITLWSFEDYPMEIQTGNTKIGGLASTLKNSYIK